ncbi:MAG: YlbF family regulator [Candidatus Sumerlaeia bacterium]
MSRITAAASTLTDLIQQEPRWIAWRDAQQALENDSRLTALFDEYRDLSTKAQTAYQNGGKLDGPDYVRLTDVQAAIQNDRKYVQREQAAGGMMELLREVNALMSGRLGINFASTAAPPSSCCCG